MLDYCRIGRRQSQYSLLHATALTARTALVSSDLFRHMDDLNGSQTSSTSMQPGKIA